MQVRVAYNCSAAIHAVILLVLVACRPALVVETRWHCICFSDMEGPHEALDNLSMIAVFTCFILVVCCFHGSLSAHLLQVITSMIVNVGYVRNTCPHRGKSIWPYFLHKTMCGFPLLVGISRKHSASSDAERQTRILCAFLQDLAFESVLVLIHNSDRKLVLYIFKSQGC
jgi:hypothetical protein